MKNLLNKITLISLFSATLISCGGGGSDSDGNCSVLGAKAFKVFGGESCNQDARSPVVTIYSIIKDKGEPLPFTICTGTLITVDDILTSAHCFVSPIAEARRAGKKIEGYLVLVGGVNGDAFKVTNYAIHPFYNGQAGSPFDIAMATLNEVPSPAVAPLPILLSEITNVGSDITSFGYGTNNKGEVGELKASNFKVTELIQGNLFVIGDGKSSICPGDSGGPAVYVTSSGKSTIAGVNSFGFGECLPNAAQAFGFVDLQNKAIIDFIASYAPDISAG